MIVATAVILSLFLQPIFTQVDSPVVQRINNIVNFGKGVGNTVNDAVQTAAGVTNNFVHRGLTTASKAVTNGTNVGKEAVDKGFQWAKNGLERVDRLADSLGVGHPVKMGTGIGKLALNGANSLTKATISGGNSIAQHALAKANTLVRLLSGVLSASADFLRWRLDSHLDTIGGAISEDIQLIFNNDTAGNTN